MFLLSEENLALLPILAKKSEWPWKGVLAVSNGEVVATDGTCLYRSKLPNKEMIEEYPYGPGYPKNEEDDPERDPVYIPVDLVEKAEKNLPKRTPRQILHNIVVAAKATSSDVLTITTYTTDLEVGQAMSAKINKEIGYPNYKTINYPKEEDEEAISIILHRAMLTKLLRVMKKAKSELVTLSIKNPEETIGIKIHGTTITGGLMPCLKTE